MEELSLSLRFPRELFILHLLLVSSSLSLCKQNFLRDLLKEAKRNNDVSENKLIEYTDIMVSTLLARNDDDDDDDAMVMMIKNHFTSTVCQTHT